MTQRVAIVTGGLQGIGLAIAQELKAQGAKVAVGARRGGDADIVTSVKATLGDDIVVAALDVQSSTSITTFVNTVAETFGAPDILVNAAGVSLHQPICGHAEADWESVIDINLNGPFRMIRACLPGMMDRGWGRIVNIASTAARVAEPTHPAYCASKAGLVGLTKAVAMEGGPRGVTCVAVSPAWVETDMLRESSKKMAERTGRPIAEIIAEMEACNPQGRLIQPEEIAAVVAFCCTDAARGLTMEDIQVNAGALW